MLPPPSGAPAEHLSAPVARPDMAERPKHKPLVKQRRRRRHDLPEWLTGKTLKLVAVLVVSIVMMAIERLV